MSAVRSDAERAATLDEHLRHVLGVAGAEYDRALAVQGPLPMAMFNHYAALIDRSLVLPQLRKWATAQRKSASGRPPVIDFRAVLVIDLLCIMWGHGVHYGEAAKTLMYRLSPAQFELLGIRFEVGSETSWYHRYWRAKKRMLRLLDPWYATGKRSRLTLQEVARARELEDDTLRDRLRWVAQALVDSSVSLMPPHYRENYPGDVAIDATLVQILGRAGRVLNVDFAAGTYDHSHRDDVTKDRPVPGYEANTVVMIDAYGKAPGPFPRLVSGLTFHRPTEQTQEARRAMEHHGRTFSKRGLVLADRAYNGLKAATFNYLSAKRVGRWCSTIAAPTSARRHQ